MPTLGPNLAGFGQKILFFYFSLRFLVRARVQFLLKICSRPHFGTLSVVNSPCGLLRFGGLDNSVIVHLTWMFASFSLSSRETVKILAKWLNEYECIFQRMLWTRSSILCVTQIGAFMPVCIEKKWRFGRVLPMPYTLTDRQTTEYRATQLV